MRRKGLAAALRRTTATDPAGSVLEHPRPPAVQQPQRGTDRPLPADALEWSWPPYAPVPALGDERFGTGEWAPPSVVWHPQVRLGRWTVVYRRES